MILVRASTINKCKKTHIIVRGILFYNYDEGVDCMCACWNSKNFRVRENGKKGKQSFSLFAIKYLVKKIKGIYFSWLLWKN